MADADRQVLEVLQHPAAVTAVERRLELPGYVVQRQAGESGLALVGVQPELRLAALDRGQRVRHGRLTVQHRADLLADLSQPVRVRPEQPQADGGGHRRPLPEGANHDLGVPEAWRQLVLQHALEALRDADIGELDDTAAVGRVVVLLAQLVVVDRRRTCTCHPGDADHPGVGADGLLDVEQARRRGGEIGPPRHPDLDLELVTVGGRKELHPEPAGQHEARDRQRAGCEQGQPGSRQCMGEQAAVADRHAFGTHAVAPPALPAGLPGEGQEPGERRDHRHGEHERGEQGEDDGGRDRADEIADVARQQEDRHEAEDGCRRRCEQRPEQVAYGRADRGARRLPRAATGDHLVGDDDRVVDQQADRDDHAEDGHLVDRFAHDVQAEQGERGRQRQRRADDQRGPPAHRQRDDEHDAGRADEQVGGEFPQPCRRVAALVEHGVDGEPGRQPGRERRDRSACRLGPTVDADVRRGARCDKDAAMPVV